MNYKKLKEIAYINPRETLKKGVEYQKVPMEAIIPGNKYVFPASREFYKGGTKFRNQDTIMARITPCLENGKIAMVAGLDELEIAFGSTEYIVFRAIENITDPNYLFYLIKSSEIVDTAIKSMVGTSGRQRVQVDVLKDIDVPCPTLENQKKISYILSTIDELIFINDQINKNLEEQAQALYAEMFQSEDSEQWDLGVLGDIAEITMGQSPNGNSYNENDVGTIFFQGRSEFGFRFPTVRLFTTEPRRMAYANDVMLSVRAPVGDINVAHEDCCIGRGLAAIHSKDNHQSYVLYTMFALRSEFDVFNGEGTIFGSINKNSLKSMPIKLPPQELIDEFEKLVYQMDTLIRINTDEIYCLQSLRDSMIPRLMSGELDVSGINV